MIRLGAAAHSKGIVPFVIFRKVLRFCSGWDALERIVTEAAALMPSRHDAAFFAHNGVLTDFCAEGAVGAISFDLFAKQHTSHSFLGSIIDAFLPNC